MSEGEEKRNIHILGNRDSKIKDVEIRNNMVYLEIYEQFSVAGA